MKKKLVLLAAVGLLLLMSTYSHAGTVSYSISVPNTTISPYPGPYGQLDVTWSAGTANKATITLTALSAGGYNYIFFDGSTLGLNTNGAVTIVGGTGGISASQPANSFFKGVGAMTLNTSGNIDGAGSFNGLVIDTNDGPKNGMNSVTFTLQKSTGSWTSENDVLAPNANGFRVAGHVAVFNSTYSGGALNTGYAADGTGNINTNTIPEPASLTLAGLGMLCLAGWRLRKRRLRGCTA